MTAPRPLMHVRAARAAVLILATFALSGCAISSIGTGSTASSSPPASSGPCTKVSIVVNFGTLDAKSIHACAPAGVAVAALAASGITTTGTTDYGDKVICRVDDLPAPAVESCATLPSAAYWALWVKSSSDGKWEYAQEGAATLQLSAGESLGLVYTQGSDTTPPQG